MPRSTNSARRCLPVVDWPEIDRHAWIKATGPVDPLDEDRSSAAAWRPATRHKNRRGYGRWLTFLARTGADLKQPMAERVTPMRINDYIHELTEQAVKLYTLRNRIGELLSVMLALVPDRNWTWLKQKYARLDAAAERAHEVKYPPLLASDIIRKCLRELAHVERQMGQVPQREAVLDRNWLMVLMITILPLRLKNFASLSLTHHMRFKNRQCHVVIEGSEAKTGRPLWMPIPAQILPHLEYYLTTARPVLLKGKSSESLWVGYKGEPMSEHAVYLRITDFTARSFGTPINPHLFRRIGATTISIVAPEQIETARALLGHSSRKTTQDSYIAANGIIASRRQAKLIANLRRRLLGKPSRHGVARPAGNKPAQSTRAASEDSGHE